MDDCKVTALQLLPPDTTIAVYRMETDDKRKDRNDIHFQGQVRLKGARKGRKQMGLYDPREKGDGAPCVCC